MRDIYQIGCARSDFRFSREYEQKRVVDMTGTLQLTWSFILRITKYRYQYQKQDIVSSQPACYGDTQCIYENNGELVSERRRLNSR